MKDIDSQNNIINNLVQALCINHFHNSFYKNEAEYFIRKYYGPKANTNDVNSNKITFPDSPSSRNIFVLGAGVSKSAYPEILPTGSKAVELIEENIGLQALQDSNPGIKAKYSELKDKLLLNKGTDDDTFEVRLSLLSHFFSAYKIRESISKLFSYRTFPSLLCEFLAHLFKNRFIDVIINFNFDEILDQSIEEEMGNGQMKRIISDGDCDSYFSYLDDNRLNKPIYIKPHGTVSHKSTLRFTKEQYLDIPDDIERVIQELFTGVDSLVNNENRQFDKLNLVILGFQMESIEFNGIIKKSFDLLREDGKKMSLLYVDYDMTFDSDKNIYIYINLSLNNFLKK